MLWGKKDDKRLLPDLPPMRNPTFLADNEGSFEHINEDSLGDEYSMEKHELPSFPDSLNDKGFSQAAIKDAVSSDEEVIPGNNPIRDSGGNKFQTIEMDEWAPSMKKEDSTQDMDSVIDNNAMQNKSKILSKSNKKLEEPTMGDYSNVRVPMRPRTNSDIFVKLDKFYSARKSLVDAQQKLEEVDALLRKIREIKMREEQELGAWEKELMSIKTKINDIAINLFEKGE